jgi:hypothetical protein
MTKGMTPKPGDTNRAKIKDKISTKFVKVGLFGSFWVVKLPNSGIAIRLLWPFSALSLARRVPGPSFFSPS